VLTLGVASAGGLNAVFENVKDFPGFLEFFGIADPVTEGGVQLAVNGVPSFGARQNYGALKNETAGAIIEGLAPIQTEYARLMGNKDYLHEIMHDGALRAGEAAAKTVKKVYAAMGFNA